MRLKRFAAAIALASLAFVIAPAVPASADGGAPVDLLACSGGYGGEISYAGSTFAVNGNLSCLVAETPRPSGNNWEVQQGPATIAINGNFMQVGAPGNGLAAGNAIVIWNGREAYQFNFVAPVVAGTGAFVTTRAIDDDGGNFGAGSGVFSEGRPCTGDVCVTLVSNIAFALNYDEVPPRP